MTVNEVQELLVKLFKLHAKLHGESYAIGYATMSHACTIKFPFNTIEKEIEAIKERIIEVEKLLKEKHDIEVQYLNELNTKLINAI